MRSLLKDRQKVWFSTAERRIVGLDTVFTYSTPVCKRLTVSATAGYPEELSSGLAPDYDRVITCYDRCFQPEEGTFLWVDVEPGLTSRGELVTEDDGFTPTVLPDYVLKRVLNTQKGVVARFGISKMRQSQ